MDTKIKIELDAQQANTSVKQLRQELKGVKDEMANLKEGSQAFNDAAKKAGELQHQLTAIGEAVRGASSDFGDMVGNIAKAGAGITGAFQAAQGALNLFGVESENVTEAIKKMQSMMAITQGLASIDNGIKAFAKLRTAIGLSSTSLNIFKKALIGTGLGALVVVLGSIITNWDEFTKSIGLSEEALTKLGNTFSGVLNVIKEGGAGIAKAFGKILKGDFKDAWEELKQGFDVKASYAAGVEQAITEREQKEFKKRAKQRQTEIDRLIAAEKALNDNEYDQKSNIIRLEQERLKYLKEGTTEYYNQLTAVKALQKELDKSFSLRGEAIKLQTKEVKNTDKLKDGTDRLHKAIQAQQEDYQNELGKTARKQQDLQDTIDATIVLSQVGFGALSDTLSAFAEMQDTATKEGFEQQKKLQIASAVMNMLGGVVSAWVSAMNPANAWMTLPGQIAMGAAQTVATVALGAAQIAKIKQQQFSSGASSGSSRASISGGASRVVAPVQYTQDVQGSKLEDTIKSSRVYVTESDITNTQRKVNVAESESRF